MELSRYTYNKHCLTLPRTLCPTDALSFIWTTFSFHAMQSTLRLSFFLEFFNSHVPLISVILFYLLCMSFLLHLLCSSLNTFQILPYAIVVSYVFLRNVFSLICWLNCSLMHSKLQLLLFQNKIPLGFITWNLLYP